MEYKEFLSAALQLVLTALLPFLVGYGIKYLKALADAKLAEIAPNLDWYDIGLAADYAVKAAEQLGITDAISDKKEYALSILKKDLARNGLELDFDLIEAALEAAVLKNFPKPKGE